MRWYMYPKVLDAHSPFSRKSVSRIDARPRFVAQVYKEIQINNENLYDEIKIPPPPSMRMRVYPYFHSLPPK